MRANDSCNLEFRRTFEGRGYRLHSWPLHLSSAARASARLRNPLGAIYFPPFRATPTATANRRAAEVKGEKEEKRKERERERRNEKKGVGRGMSKGVK